MDDDCTRKEAMQWWNSLTIGEQNALKCKYLNDIEKMFITSRVIKRMFIAIKGGN